MSLADLKAAIERKRRKPEDAAAAATTPAAAAAAAATPAAAAPTAAPAFASKYRRRGDIEREEEEARARQRREEEDRVKKERDEEARILHEEAERKRLRREQKEGAQQSSASSSLARLQAAEVIRRLRALKEPATLFGEDAEARAQRLHAVEIARADSTRLNADDNPAETGANDFQRTLEQLDDGELLEDQQEAGEQRQLTEDDQYLEVPAPDADRLQSSPADRVFFTFRNLLVELLQQLEERPLAEKKSVAGKREFARFKQTQQYLRPLFRGLRNNTLEADILRALTEIADLMPVREYVRANDAYLRLAIGNAPWPMGVTMVGIHERSAREKIFSNQVAHVLNNETQRKYIQSIKRLMTFAQSKYPTDPSKMLG